MNERMQGRGRTVAASTVSSMIDLMEAAGVSRAEQLAASGLTEAELHRPDGRLGLARLERMLENGRRFPVPSMPDPEVVASACPLEVMAAFNAGSLGEALRLFVTYRPLYSDIDHLEVRIGERQARLEYVATDLPRYAAMQAHATFCQLAGLVRYYQQDAPARFTAQLAGGSHVQASLETCLQAKVHQANRRNVLDISVETLHQPFPAFNPLLARAMRRELDGRLRDLSAPTAFASTVARLLATVDVAGPLPAPKEALAFVCANLGVSRWTIARRLAEEGTSFEALGLRVRLERARQLLDDPSIPVSEVGERTGFRTPSSFTRFFHRSTGETPLAYRASGARRRGPDLAVVRWPDGPIASNGVE